MKIVIVSCVAPPETVVAGRVNYDICEHLSNLGHKVTLITPFPSRPLGKFDIKQNKKNESIEVNINFNHIKINSYKSPQFNFLKRIYESFSFGFKSVSFINKNIKYANLIYATPWPFIGQFIFLFLRKNKSIPLIMNVQDLYPESFFTKYNSKVIKYLFNPLITIDKYIAKNSTHLTVVSETMKNTYLLNRKIEPSKLSIIENWQNEDEFISNYTTKDEVLFKYNLELVKEKFIFMYLGNIGPVADLENVIHQYSKMNKRDSVLIIAGSGSSKNNCIDLANAYEMQNVIFVDIPTGLKSVVELQSISDVLLLPIQPDASESSIPSKLIAYMFSSKPILSSAKIDSTTGKAISLNNCGLLVNEINTWEIQMSKFLKMDQSELETMGCNAFNFGIKNYSKKIGLSKIENLFNKIINNN